MVQYSINDISKRTQIANTMEGLVDSALVTRPRAGGGNFRIATVTAFFLRDLQRSEEHTSELQSQSNLVCRLLLEKKKKKRYPYIKATKQTISLHVKI